jgi:hypothetical protein
MAEGMDPRGRLDFAARLRALVDEGIAAFGWQSTRSFLVVAADEEWWDEQVAHRTEALRNAGSPQ